MRSAENEQKRRNFIEQTLDKIRNVPRYSNFYLETFCVIANFGLQIKAKQERLFENEDWNDPGCRDELIKKVERFLNKYIK